MTVWQGFEARQGDPDFKLSTEKLRLRIQFGGRQ